MFTISLLSYFFLPPYRNPMNFFCVFFFLGGYLWSASVTLFILGVGGGFLLAYPWHKDFAMSRKSKLQENMKQKGEGRRGGEVALKPVLYYSILFYSMECGQGSVAIRHR